MQSLQSGDLTTPISIITSLRRTRAIIPWRYLLVYAGDFGADMPELNLDSAAVREEIASVAAFWWPTAPAFRLDAVTHYYDSQPERNRAFLAWLCERSGD